MKRPYYIALFLAIVAVLMMTSGGFLMFLTSYRNDVHNQKEIVLNVRKEYLAFNDQTKSFEEQLAKFQEVFGFYFEDMKENQEVTLDTLNQIEQIMIDMDSSTSVLKNTCKSSSFASSEIMTKCAVFQKNYETIINTYVKMILCYNHAVDEYNAWAKDEVLNHFTSQVRNSYLDFDNDGIYLGA